jgi:DNA primase
MTKIQNSRDFEVVSDALRKIRFPIPYPDWVRIGFALWDSFGMDGMQLLYDVSCAPFEKYRNETPEKLAAKFRSANGSVSLGTIFHIARQHGWKYKQPTKIENEAWHLVAWHDYRDAQGNFAYRINRYVSPDGKEKRMTIERYENGKKKNKLPPEFRLPYNLPQVHEAIRQGKTIYFVEGESDADALTANDYTATCVPFGACGWNQRYAEHFKGASICFIPDNDETGKTLPLKAIPDLLSVAKEVKVIELSDAKDVRDLINAKGIEAFRSLTPIDASQYLEKHKLSENYPLTKINASVPENDLDDELDELDESEQPYDVAIPELPNGLFKRVYDYIAAFDVPREFALTSATALLASILGDRVGFYFEDENEGENEGEMIFANDFFIQIAEPSSGKSTASKRVRSLLRRIDKKILKPDGKCSELLYKNAATARGLIDQIRHESDAERIRREAAERDAEKSGKALPPKRTPQTSGLWVLDEFVQLLESFNSEFNAELSSIILSLWDNTEFSRQTKSDGAIDVPQTSITILGNSTPEAFWEALPANADRRGFLQRMLIVTTKESRQKTMLQVKYTKKKNVARNVLCEDLLQFFCYCAKRPPVKFLPEECVPVEREFCSRYQSSDKVIKAFLGRLNVRLLKFSMIVGACKAFETRAPEIVIDARTMEQASAILDFFVRSTINFITSMTLEGQKPIDAVGKTKARMLSLLRERFDGEVKRKILRDYLKVGDQLFEKALAELKESGKVRIEKRKVRGQKSVFVTLTSKFSSPFSTSPCNNHNSNSTETQTAEKLGKKGEESPFFTLSSPFFTL